MDIEPNSKTRIILAEDHNLLREGLRLALKSEETCEIVGETVNELQTIDMVNHLQPDFLILDISSQALKGMETIPVIKQKCPNTKILLITTGEDNESAILGALKAGARGYLSKNSSLKDIKRAIDYINQDEMWIERKLFTKFFEKEISFNPKERESTQSGPLQSLTTREQEVLRMLSKGSTNKEIANDLFICEKTVKSHLNRIFRKLNVSRRLEAILYAIRNGIV